jgi:metal-sulfur cluster biosynthetic enzyme
MAMLLMNEAFVLEALKEVIDPELGINVVDLGLIYEVDIEGANVSVTMTLTTPGCPLHESIGAAVREALDAYIPGIGEVAVNLVWDPPWTPDRLSEEGRLALGWLE